MRKKELKTQADQIMQLAEESGVENNYFFVTTFERYQVQLRILEDLEEISKRDSWWKEVRSAEVHLDLPILYESRHKEINESQVVMETMRLIPFFIRFNELLTRMGDVHLAYMFEHLSNEDKVAVLSNPELLNP